ncbi:Wee1-like protein kinase [Thalictrum thalictroides]|uniref:Wee1-like protein kinase n=1 Tax=Thalictrum thalictroides TaxID=46969 RepID=A0A7J6UT04_THATH|nr:Wee1-like protein kinase [Thalictrum thalictroides]
MKKSTLARHLSVQLGQVSLIPLLQQSSSSSSTTTSNPSRFQKFLEEKLDGHRSSSLSIEHLDNNCLDDKDCILSQDFFCTPDYITPDGQQISYLDCNKENIECPRSPEKVTTAKSKRLRKGGFAVSFGSESPLHNLVMEVASDALGSDEVNTEKSSVTGSERKPNYVSQSAVALRCRVMPPPCVRNPYSKETAEMDVDPFGNQRSKSLAAGIFPTENGDGLSRYRTDFHEIEQIGWGNFSRVFKVLKRIDGCMYAVKHSIRQLHLDTERTHALMEVQALAALGYHQNTVGYYNSWFENAQLYIQMELCDRSLSITRSSQLLSEEEILKAMHQVAKALQFIHERGIAHLDVKPDNIYVKNGVYKLGDFGCATLIDGSLPIEEGDARYMPLEILNDNYDHLDKVDIFSLGAAIYELIKRSPLPKSGPQLLNLREGKISLLPGHSIQFQNLLKVMVDPNPVKRPSAKELLEHSIFDRFDRP